MTLRIFAWLCVSASLLCTAACSRVSTSGSAQAEHDWTRPGILRWGEYTEPDTLNPMLSSLQVTVEESMLWAGYLFEYDDTNRFVPELATDVPTLADGGISQDGTRITYHLRRGVRWQDGAPFTADDVIFSWHAVMNPANDVPSRSCYDLIRSIDRVDDHTIVVHLSRPYAPFTATFFTMAAFAYPVLPAHLLAHLPDINHAAYDTMPIGTGPFRVVEYRHGQTLRLVANRDYWRGPPRLREVDISYVGDQNTLLTQLRTHEIDLVTNVSFGHAPELSGISGVTVHAIPFTYFTYIGFNEETSALRDVRVRRALALGADVPRIVADVTHGYGLAADSDQPPFSWAHLAQPSVFRHDPSAAGRLLDDAGWRLRSDGFRYRDGQKLELVMASTAGNVAYRGVEAMLQQQWQQLGVATIVKNAPDSVLYAPAADGGVFASGSFDVLVNGWFNGIDPDDSAMFACDQRPPNGDDYSRECDPQLDAAERAALATDDTTQRKQDYATIQRILARDRPVVFLWFAKRIDVANSDLRGYRPAHVETTLWNTWQWSI